MTKKCGKCKRSKPLDEFYKNRSKRDGRDDYCKKCRSKRSKKYNDDPGNKDKKLRLYFDTPRGKRHKITAARWWKRVGWLRRISRKYGVTPQEYEDKLSEQNGVCAICARPNGKIRLAVDHDHKTGKVRGLLCNRCNIVLGLLNDGIDLFDKLRAYLQAHQNT
jgi:hypothetical protein